MNRTKKNSPILPQTSRVSAILSMVAAVEDGASPDASISWNDAHGNLIKVHVAKYSK